MSRKGLHIMVKHPVQTDKIVIAGAAREIFGPGTDTVARFLPVRSSPALTGVLFVWNLRAWSFALVGAVVAPRSRWTMFWVFVVSLLVYVVAVSAGAEASARFRARHPAARDPCGVRDPLRRRGATRGSRRPLSVW